LVLVSDKRQEALSDDFTYTKVNGDFTERLGQYQRARIE